MKFNHSDLVEKAAKWLQRKHGVVVTEMVTYAGEIPDAIGFSHFFSTLIECKVTRQDFRTDIKKYFRRQPDKGMGTCRYYLTAKGLLKEDELPNGWGLLEIHGRGIRIAKKSRQFDKNELAEITLLVSAIRRIGSSCPKGISVKFYTYRTKNKATMGVSNEKF